MKSSGESKLLSIDYRFFFLIVLSVGLSLCMEGQWWSGEL